MKRILALWTIGFLLMTHPSLAVVMVGFGTTTSAYTLVFSDDFNRADSTTVGGSWTSESDTGGNLAIQSNKLIWEDNASTAAYVEKTGLTAISEGAIECTVSVSSITVPSGRSIQVCGAPNRVIVQIGASGTTLNRINVVWYNESGSPTTAINSYTLVGATDYSVRLEFKSATTASGTDGYYKLYVNSSLVGENLTLGNYSKTVTSIRAGNMYMANWGSDTGQTVYIDDVKLYGKN